jgi:antitoxin component of RelBE/YafQ-DinJ toxin-antitoxin module
VEQVLTQMGIPPKGAAMYIEMYKAINTGVLIPLEPRSPENSTKTSFENFVQDVFAAAYHGLRERNQ